MKVLVAAIAMLLAADVQDAAADQAGAPFEPVAVSPYYINADGSMTVPVTINGRGPYNFIIDTGSTITIAFDNLAAIETFPEVDAPPKRVLGISSAATLPPHLLGDVAVGAAAMRDHVGVILRDWSLPRTTPHGILGIDFFRQYAVVFDTDKRVMTLYRHGELPKDITSGWRRVKLEARAFADISGKLFIARAQLNRSSMTFIIDLGSISSLVNYTAAEAIFSGILTTNTEITRATSTRLGDVFDDRTVTRTGRFDEIRVGPLVWRRQLLWMKDAPIFEELGVASEPYGLLGLDLLARKDFALDFGENRLYVSR